LHSRKRGRSPRDDCKTPRSKKDDEGKRENFCENPSEQLALERWEEMGSDNLGIILGRKNSGERFSQMCRVGGLPDFLSSKSFGNADL